MVDDYPSLPPTLRQRSPNHNSPPPNTTAYIPNCPNGKRTIMITTGRKRILKNMQARSDKSTPVAKRPTLTRSVCNGQIYIGL
jgi:hypothetical protein